MTIDAMFQELGPNAGYAEELYELFLIDPSLVGESWARYFSQFRDAQSGANGVAVTAPLARPSVEPAKANGNGHHVATAYSEKLVSATPALDYELQHKVFKLIEAYRAHGHLSAKINPLVKGQLPLPQATDLEISRYGFSAAELTKAVNVAGAFGQKEMTLNELISNLQRCYSGSVGSEVSHLHVAEEREWLFTRIEQRRRELTLAEREGILKQLVAAENFESQLHQKYVGTKRFSLQGGETLIPIMQVILDRAVDAHLREVVIGMAHRGRLSVLANVVKKPLKEIFSEFEDQSIFSSLGSGDVKYHLGFESVYKREGSSSLKVSLTPNPSHLEFVNPVVEGIARAKQDLYYQRDRLSVVPLLIHGDSAMIGQGVVPETLLMSRLEGYKTGGTVHIVVNNQVGFTLDPIDSRSSAYCTELCKAVDAPVFHVNAEDPEACCWATELAFEFRQKYERDVVIDLYCYRKYGHNEADDPSFTQPVIYSEIKSKKSITELYGESLIARGLLSAEQVKAHWDLYLSEFERAYSGRSALVTGETCSTLGKIREQSPETAVASDLLKKVANTLVSYPQGFSPHPKLAKILEKRIEILEEGKGIDWAFAEALAFGSLVLDGITVRLSGQDCGRGTFSHRHLLLRDFNNGAPFQPLQLLSKEFGGFANFEVYNSPLSETGVMGFEFGFASIMKGALVMWEGQFGDFANGAQVIIDQFLAGSEAKWSQLSGLVLLLPHGYEGQGPEHSSARLERYLQLCAQGNMTVTYPTTAAQYFHMLRRQGMTAIKRPLVVMTPKSLLRHPEAAVTRDELTHGRFNPIIVDHLAKEQETKAFVFVSGKLAFEARQALKAHSDTKATLVRIEELYPFPAQELKELLAKSPKVDRFVWVQEEPRNMGAWSYIHEQFREELGVDLKFAGRPAGASTATGSAKRHAAEQSQLLNEMVRLCK